MSASEPNPTRASSSCWAWRLALVLVSSVWGVLVPSEAHAEQFGRGYPGWFLMPGVNGGVRFGGGVGALSGAELSLVHADEDLFWKGAYVDANYDWGWNGIRASVGPEIGYQFFGLDGGYVVDAGQDRARHGFVARGVLTAGMVGLHCRFGQFLESDGQRFLELGLSLKLPAKL